MIPFTFKKELLVVGSNKTHSLKIYSTKLNSEKEKLEIDLIQEIKLKDSQILMEILKGIKIYGGLFVFFTRVIKKDEVPGKNKK